MSGLSVNHKYLFGKFENGKQADIIIGIVDSECTCSVPHSLTTFSLVYVLSFFYFFPLNIIVNILLENHSNKRVVGSKRNNNIKGEPILPLTDLKY